MKYIFMRYYDKRENPNGELYGVAWRQVVRSRFDPNECLLVNEAGGRCDISDNYIWLETATLEYDENENINLFEQLDWTNTYLNDPSQTSGWLSPDGIFYGCPYGGHISSARLLFKTTERDLELRGFTKIHSKSNYFCEKGYTEVQAKWLIEHGYTH